MAIRFLSFLSRLVSEGRQEKAVTPVMTEEIWCFDPQRFTEVTDKDTQPSKICAKVKNNA
jgi:hypothetical protein